MTSQRARWRPKSPASRLFTQPFVQAQIKENIEDSLHWPLWGESTGDLSSPSHEQPCYRQYRIGRFLSMRNVSTIYTISMSRNGKNRNMFLYSLNNFSTWCLSGCLCIINNSAKRSGHTFIMPHTITSNIHHGSILEAASLASFPKTDHGHWHFMLARSAIKSYLPVFDQPFHCIQYLLYHETFTELYSIYCTLESI